MSIPLEDKDSPTLKARLQALGFEQVQFEPKVNNRFIVYTDEFPSYTIKGFSLPAFGKNGWSGALTLLCYNPLGENLEAKALKLVAQNSVQFTIKILSPTAEVDTTWEITATDGEVHFGAFDWADDGQPNLLTFQFRIADAKVTNKV